MNAQHYFQLVNTIITLQEQILELGKDTTPSELETVQQLKVIIQKLEKVALLGWLKLNKFRNQ